MRRRVGMRWIPLLLCCGFVNTCGAVFLERGQYGFVPCPLIKSCTIPPGDVDAAYWYYGSTRDTSILISYFLGSVAPQNGIPEGVYDIDNECNLIIENVTASNEGTYYFQVKPHLQMIEEGQVEVSDKVSPSRPYPTVIGCNQDHDADTCEVRVRHDSTVHNLTCVMEQVKPAVQLRWIRLFLGGQTELNASTAVRPVLLPAYTGSSLRNNTYSTSASVQVAAVDDEEVYACEAVGVVVGKGARMIVRITNTHPTTTIHAVRSSNNPGTTLISTANKPVESLVALIVLGVTASILFISTVIMCAWNRHLNKKLDEFNRTSNMRPDTPVDIDSSSEGEANEFFRTTKIGLDAPTETESSSEEDDETSEFHHAPKPSVETATDGSVQTDSTDDWQ